jgi:hypothetical protein
MTVFPTATTEKQLVPKKPASNSFVIRVIGESPESETAYHVRKDRDYQIIYFHEEAESVLNVMGQLSDAIFQRNVIPIKDSLRYIRAESFSFSQPFETENELIACIGIMQTRVREAPAQETAPLINEINVAINKEE